MSVDSALASGTFEVKGTLGRWSTRYFTLCQPAEGARSGELLLTCFADEAASRRGRPQSVRVVTGLNTIANRAAGSYRQHRFNIELQGGATSALAAPSAPAKQQWEQAVRAALGAGALRNTELREDEDDEADEQKASEEENAALRDARDALGNALAQKYEQAFKAADAEDGRVGDGVLNIDELRNVAVALGRSPAPSRQELEVMAKDSDADGDGGVNLVEFLSAMRSRRWGVRGDGDDSEETDDGNGDDDDEDEDDEADDEDEDDDEDDDSDEYEDEDEEDEDEDEAEDDDEEEEEEEDMEEEGPTVRQLGDWFKSGLSRSHVHNGPFMLLSLPESAPHNDLLLRTFESVASAREPTPCRLDCARAVYVRRPGSRPGSCPRAIGSASAAQRSRVKCCPRDSRARSLRA